MTKDIEKFKTPEKRNKCGKKDYLLESEDEDELDDRQSLYADVTKIEA